MAVAYEFVYELMKAYKDSKLLVNKRVIGGRVSEFLDIPNSYKQVIIDEKGNKTLYQYFEFKLPGRFKTEKAITKYLKRLEEKFQGKLLEVSNEEIEKFNQYWDLEFIGLVGKLEDKNCAGVIKPNGESVYISLEKGKVLSDVYQILFKPLPYF